MSDKRRKTPTFQVGDDYYSYEQDVEIWQLATTLPVEKQGADLFLELIGDAKEHCRSLTIAQLKTDGVKNVLAKVKELYAKDKHVVTFQALENFESFTRDDNMDIDAFINEFDNRYFKVKTHCQMEYPNEALAYKLLKACNLTDDDARLARATTELDFNKMKSHLRSVFSNLLTKARTGTPLAVKVESTYSDHSSAVYSSEPPSSTLYGQSSGSSRKF